MDGKNCLCASFVLRIKFRIVYFLSNFFSLSVEKHTENMKAE